MSQLSINPDTMAGLAEGKQYGNYKPEIPSSPFHLLQQQLWQKASV
jgi:hypothetical protein